MNKFLKALTVLAASVAIASPAAAQFSGQLDLNILPGFSSKASFDYATKLSANVNFKAGLDYTFNFSPATPSALAAYVRVTTPLASNFLIGGRLRYTLTDIGVSNASSLTLRLYGIYNAVSSDTLFIDITPKIDVGLVGGFYIDVLADVDGGYSINEQFALFFGASTGIGVVPGFAWYGVYPYIEIDFYPTDQLTLYAGTSVSIANAFSWDGAYLGVRYDINNMFALKLQANYSTAFSFTLSGLYNR
jgi:hypothetical protein